MGAVEWLEKKYSLPPMPFEATDDVAPATPSQQIADSIVTSQTFDEIREQARKRLDRVTKERGLPLDTLLMLWGDFDRLVYEAKKEQIPEWKAKKEMLMLLARTLEKMNENQRGKHE